MHEAGSNRRMMCNSDAVWDADAGVVPAWYGFPLSLPALHACMRTPHQHKSALIQSNLLPRLLGCTHSTFSIAELTSSRTCGRPAQEDCEARVTTADGSSHVIENLYGLHLETVIDTQIRAWIRVCRGSSVFREHAGEKRTVRTLTLLPVSKSTG